MPVIRADLRSGRAVERFTLVLTKPAVAPRFRHGRGFGSVRIEFNQTVTWKGGWRHPLYRNDAGVGLDDVVLPRLCSWSVKCVELERGCVQCR